MGVFFCVCVCVCVSFVRVWACQAVLVCVLKRCLMSNIELFTAHAVCVRTGPFGHRVELIPLAHLSGVGHTTQLELSQACLLTRQPRRLARPGVAVCAV